MSEGIGKVGIEQYRDSVSVWRVYLPSDIDRDRYISSCYNTGTITIVNENGEVVHRVKIGKLAIQLIDFPIDINSVGSEVLCVCLPYSGELRVVEVYNTFRQSVPQNENQYQLIKRNVNGTSFIVIDGQGNLILGVDGDKDNGIFKINISNQQRTGELNILINGETVINSNGNNLTLKTIKQVLIDSPSIKLNDSDEPILLGNKTVKLIGDLLDQLAQESAGPYPLLGQQKYSQIKEDIETLKSELSFVK